MVGFVLAWGVRAWKSRWTLFSTCVLSGVREVTERQTQGPKTACIVHSSLFYWWYLYGRVRARARCLGLNKQMDLVFYLRLFSGVRKVTECPTQVPPLDNTNPNPGPSKSKKPKTFKVWLHEAGLCPCQCSIISPLPPPLRLQKRPCGKRSYWQCNNDFTNNQSADIL